MNFVLNVSSRFYTNFDDILLVHLNEPSVFLICHVIVMTKKARIKNKTSTKKQKTKNNNKKNNRISCFGPVEFTAVPAATVIRVCLIIGF